MRYSLSALVLATFTVSKVAAGPIHHAHQHFHEKKDVAPAPEAINESEADVLKREPGWQDVDFSKLDWSKISITYSSGQTFGQATPAPVVANVVAPVVQQATPTPAPTTAKAAATSAAAIKLADTPKVDTALTNILSTTLTTVAETALKALGEGVTAGINALTQAGGVWLGSDGQYTNEFTNASDEDLILVVWGPWASWINAHKPLITVSIPKGGKTVVSFAEGSVGGFAPIYADTKLVNGQLFETWGEHTFTYEGVVDVSREVNMNGHSMSIVGPKCTTDMNTCVFKCNSGQSCMTGYSLVNCANGSQAGATFGQHEGADTGGCAWRDNKVALKTTFH